MRRTTRAEQLLPASLDTPPAYGRLWVSVRRTKGTKGTSDEVQCDLHDRFRPLRQRDRSLPKLLGRADRRPCVSSRRWVGHYPEPDQHRAMPRFLTGRNPSGGPRVRPALMRPTLRAMVERSLPRDWLWTYQLPIAVPRLGPSDSLLTEFTPMVCSGCQSNL